MASGKLFVLLAAAALLSFGSHPEGLRMCGQKLTNLLVRTCTFRTEQWPCFKGERFYPDGYASKGLEIRTSTRLGVATECCDNFCEISSITRRCCFTIECLHNCYPDTGYQEIDGEILDVRAASTTPVPVYEDEYDSSEELEKRASHGA
ncbi:hypothetical protein QR680_017586 [Steinernema hermaphroditum]|uniref:Insulin-like domain-containing protein n=1 Tax=Steinernema hermaphroditum TaxID=289476 RepID=A0AA39LPK6_9BILA|nr:hypothetical protein QR680_017586 [Steinernema hermaphroditum]